MDELYFVIIHNNLCKKCFCKIDEYCSLNCNYHIKINNSLNLINKIKNKINQNKSFNIESEKKKKIQKNSSLLIKKKRETFV